MSQRKEYLEKQMPMATGRPDSELGAPEGAEIAKLPAPAAGRWKIASDSDGRSCPSLEWSKPDGEQVESFADRRGLLWKCQRDATWLPPGWTMDVFPPGWSLPSLEAWFAYALDVCKNDTNRKTTPEVEEGPSYWPTPRGLVAHAFLIVRLLGLPDSPTEPRRKLDRMGCRAELLDVLEFFRRALGPHDQGGAEGHDKAGTGSNRPKRIPLAEAAILVRDWLAKHAKENPAGITRDAVAAGTGVSTGTVSKTAAWKAFRDRRDAEVKPGAREVPLSETMQAVVPADCASPDELAVLMEEQERDRAEEERRHKRRHEPS